MFTYQFSKEPLKLGEYDPKYGQSYWAEVTEHLEPVKFNVMTTDQIDLEDQIECEERVQKRSAKGKDYYQLKKVKVHKAYSQPGQAVPFDGPIGGPGFNQAVAAHPPQVDNSQLDRIEKQLTLILEGINDLKGVDDGAEEG